MQQYEYYNKDLICAEWSPSEVHSKQLSLTWMAKQHKHKQTNTQTSSLEFRSGAL